jgi:hypothetical protein
MTRTEGEVRSMLNAAIDQGEDNRQQHHNKATREIPVLQRVQPKVE